MKLEYITDFGPEVAREPLEEMPLCQLMVTQLEDHKAQAGEQAQSQINSRAGAAIVPVGMQGLAHGGSYVHAQRNLKPTGVQQGKAVTAQRQAFSGEEQTGPRKDGQVNHWSSTVAERVCVLIRIHCTGP